MNTKPLGQLGEQYACMYLRNKGYKILEMNFRNKMGEIDLIALDKKIVCFIEVKTRKTLHYGAPFEAVHSTKQQKIVQIALCYLKYKFKTIDVPSRFDVISIYQSPFDPPIIKHLVNAFDLSYLSH